MTEPSLPQERDLPPGRLTQMKEELMTLIDPDVQSEPPTAHVVARRPRWPRLGLVAAALAAALGIGSALVLSGNESASANTAERNDDGSITITIREGKNPEELEQRLNDLGVPAVVDFLDSGFGCDPARSTGWVEEPRGEELFSHSPADDAGWVLHPDQLRAGETAVFEFQIDEQGDDIAANVNLRLSTSPVGPCVPVADDSVVDAEAGVAGG